MNTPNLTPRLKTIYDMVENCGVFSDIGTDHAYLPVALAIEGKCQRAIASDIAKGPLMRAKDTVLKYRISDKVELRLGAGLDSLQKNEADVICIAGMGGLMIADILKNGEDKLGFAKSIILQPMSSVPDLRFFLNENGYVIERELLAKEEEKIYNIMSVSISDKKNRRILSDAELLAGRELIAERPEFFDEYIDRLILKTEKIIKGLENSNNLGNEISLKQKVLSDLYKIKMGENNV